MDSIEPPRRLALHLVPDLEPTPPPARNTSAFDQAVVKRLGFEGEYSVNVSPCEEQVGTCLNDTCFEDVTTFWLNVYPLRWVEKPTGLSFWLKELNSDRPSFEHTFASIPEIWDWLAGSEVSE